jgi:coenzyme PQQ precursor peptide PqqA
LICPLHWRNISPRRALLPENSFTGASISSRACSALFVLRKKVMWKKPEFVDLRLGLEVTLYISNR